MGSFGNICRLCCNEGSDLIGIFNPIGYQYDFSGKIKKYLSIKIAEYDFLPKQLCHQCISDLEKVVEFIKKSQQAQKLLAELHKTMQSSRDDSDGGEVEPLDHNIILPPPRNSDAIFQDQNSTDMYSGPIDKDNGSDLDMDIGYHNVIQLKLNKTSENICGNKETECSQVYTKEVTLGDSGEDSAEEESNSRVALLCEPIVNIEESFDDQRDNATNISFADDSSSCELKCSICSQEFQAMSSLLLHHRLVHGEEPEPKNPLMCIFCSQTYRDLDTLTDHVGQMHTGQVHRGAGLTNLPLQQRTDASSTRSQSLHKNTVTASQTNNSLPWYHQLNNSPVLTITSVLSSQQRHNNSNSAAEDTDSDSLSASDANFTRCEICNKFYHPNYIRKHLLVHQEDRPFQCNLCDKAFKGSEGLRQHKVQHVAPDDKYKWCCTLCDSKFMNKGALAVHIKCVHHKIKEYDCRYCSRAFGSKTSAEIHERTHSDEKPFECEVCGWKCNSQVKLKTHQRVHSDEKPFACPTCGKRTRSKKELKQHEMIHSDYRPYGCHYCEKRFRSSSQLKVHERQHTGERPYSCPWCPKTFCDFGNCQKHTSRMHKEEYELAQREKMLAGGSVSSTVTSVIDMVASDAAADKSNSFLS